MPGQRRSRVRESLFLILLLITAAILASAQWRTSVSAWAPGPHDSFETILLARIEPATQVNLSSEYSATVARVHVAPGAQVHPGDLLITLENGEIASQVSAAEKR